MRSIDVAWAAGIIEGEGCPHWSQTLRLTVAMTDLDIIQRLKTLFGTGGNSRPKKNVLSSKPYYTASWSGSRAAEILMTVFAFLGKRRRAKVVWCLEKWKGQPGCGATSAQAKERWERRRLRVLSV